MRVGILSCVCVQLTLSHCTSWHCGSDTQCFQWRHTWLLRPTGLWRPPCGPYGRLYEGPSPRCHWGRSSLDRAANTGSGGREKVKVNEREFSMMLPVSKFKFPGLLTWITAGESCLAAQCMGVSPLRSLMSVRAWLSSSSSLTHTRSPRSHARCSGVRPAASREFIWLKKRGNEVMRCVVTVAGCEANKYLEIFSFLHCNIQRCKIQIFFINVRQSSLNMRLCFFAECSLYSFPLRWMNM